MNKSPLRALVAAFTLSLAATTALAQTAAQPQTFDGIDPARIRGHVEVLASDAFEGRGPGTEGERKTVRYLIEQLRGYGLQPGGVNGSWTQPVTLVRHENATTPVSSVRIGRQTKTLEYGTQVVLNTRRAGQTRVRVANAPMVFVGYGVTAPEKGYSDYAGVDMRGKIAVVLINDADFDTGDDRGFGGKAMSYAGRWTYKYEEAFRQGAIGAIIIHDTAGAAYGWPTVLFSWGAPQFDMVPADRSKPTRSILEGWITQDTAFDLFKAAGRDLAADMLAARERGFKPIPLNMRFSSRFDVKETTIDTQNVIAKRPGTAAADEFVLIGAHHDHLGRGREVNGDDIYNGAVDNATGTGALLELARVAAAAPATRRTLVFAFWAAEEKGLLGSEFYALNPLYDPARTAAGFNFDGLGQLGRTRDVQVIGSGKSTLEDDLARLIGDGRIVRPDDRPEAGFFYRSDHFPLAKIGVPQLYLKSGAEVIGKPAGVAEAAAADYTARRYHQPDDEITADWDLTGGAEDTALVWRIARDVANSAAWPQWRAGGEFEPARAASAAKRP
jgi:Zn-dependent M28 family amino/carboxypeptidase